VPQVGLTYVRGCEVEGMLDHLGRVIEEGPDPKPKIPGGQRTYRVWYPIPTIQSIPISVQLQ